ncbi:MAG: RNA polymerase sigma factor [Candidatus Aminicenantales bacterium]
MELETVIRRCLEGDQGAWKMLINMYSKKVFNMAFQFSGNYHAAEDMTQEIFFKLYSSLPKYDTEKNFSAWLLTLAKNHLIDEYRRKKLEKSKRDNFDEHYLTSSESDTPEHALLRKENHKAVWEGLNFLSPELRMVIILRDIQGKKYEEIAEMMELPLGTVKSRVNRGRVQLAKILREKKEREK